MYSTYSYCEVSKYGSCCNYTFNKVDGFDEIYY
jgi:hypothetical protein